MSYLEIYEKLKALQVKAFSLSKIDRSFVRDTSKELSVQFNPQSKCQDCYRDQIIILSIAVKKHLSVIENENTVYKMVSGKSIKWRSFIINDETLTDELAENFISNVRKWSNFIQKK